MSMSNPQTMIQEIYPQFCHHKYGELIQSQLIWHSLSFFFHLLEKISGKWNNRSVTIWHNTNMDDSTYDPIVRYRYEIVFINTTVNNNIVYQNEGNKWQRRNFTNNTGAKLFDPWILHRHQTERTSEHSNLIKQAAPIETESYEFK